ncbi:hypothetical protein Tco_0913437 [Tanacetum coccineum]
MSKGEFIWNIDWNSRKEHERYRGSYTCCEYNTVSDLDWNQLSKKKSPLSGDILNTVRDQLSKTKIQCSCDIFNTGWDQWSKGTNIMSKGAFILNIDWNSRKERERLEAVVEEKESAFCLRSWGTRKKNVSVPGEISLIQIGISCQRKKCPLSDALLNTYFEYRLESVVEEKESAFDLWSKGTCIMSKGAFILNINWNSRKERERYKGSYTCCENNMISDLDWNQLLRKESLLSGDILNTSRDQLSKTKRPRSCDIFNTGWDQCSKGTNIMSKGEFISNIDWNSRKERERDRGSYTCFEYNAVSDLDWNQLSKKKSPLSGDILNTGQD